MRQMGREVIVTMRAAAFALLITLAPAAAFADPAPSNEALPADQLVATYYPTGAKAAGVEGAATLSCHTDARLALRDCALVSETPAGQGFGQAALAMAGLSKDNPKFEAPDAASAAPFVFKIRFSLNPPAISPNVTGWRHAVADPDIAHGPTPRDMLRAFPQAAVAAHQDGEAKLDCQVTLAGALTACRVAEETPPGLGFGAAALKLAPDFSMIPESRDGEPVDGGQVTVPIVFKLGAAPGTAPPEASDPAAGNSAAP